MKRTLLVALVALAACASVPPDVINGPTAALGQVAVVDGLRIRPLKVIEDSRCPINVVCVWAGRLTVRTEIDGGAGAEIPDLTLGVPLDLGELSVTLVSAEPAAIAGEPIKPAAYRFTYHVQRD